MITGGLQGNRVGYCCEYMFENYSRTGVNSRSAFSLESPCAGKETNPFRHTQKISMSQAVRAADGLDRLGQLVLRSERNNGAVEGD